tara:strand:- start:1388 stop:2182 length:795 start_codon:yes stop_codon:yes gene_type:complete
MSSIGISIILPTLNEEENLKKIIPEIIYKFQENNLSYEIVVVDDNSSDNTELTMNKFISENPNIKFVKRKNDPSLPLSIYEGIENSKFEYVMWLDADGSMPVDDMLKLVMTQKDNINDVIIGSRFVKDGGYKGVKDLSKNKLFQAIKSVKDSNDSVLGMIFSIMFNRVLNFLMRVNVKDLTSGFVIGKKEYFSFDIFKDAEYGEYFIFLVKHMITKKIKMVEVGYICETRIHGDSKTASNILQLFRRGIPYLKVAFKLRKNDGN